MNIEQTIQFLEDNAKPIIVKKVEPKQPFNKSLICSKMGKVSIRENCSVCHFKTKVDLNRHIFECEYFKEWRVDNEN